MLVLTQNINQISYAELMNVYEESIRLAGTRDYPHLSDAERMILAEQDAYTYLENLFEYGGWFAAWAPSGHYQAALRLERYADGLLITALETAPSARERGYASALLAEIVKKFSEQNIYAHIYADNQISLYLHEKAGFKRLDDKAVFLDGTVSTDAYTYVL